MANNLTLSTAGRNAALNAVTALLNAGGTGTLTIYDGTQPATPDTAVTTQHNLVQFTLNSTAFASASSGSSTANTIASATVSTSGTAAWFRFANNAGAGVVDGTVGTSGCDLNLSCVTLSSGNTETITSYQLNHP